MGKHHTEEWVLALGEMVVQNLRAQFNRAFDFRQAGPYSNGHSIGIFFNDDELRRIRGTVSTDKADFRFGFVCWAQFDTANTASNLSAGFQVSNKALARAAFVPNVKESRNWVALKLQRWLVQCETSPYLWFEEEGGSNYNWSQAERLGGLERHLSRYGDFDRKSTGKFKDLPSDHRGTHFSVGRYLDEFDNLTEAGFLSHAKRISIALQKVFGELGFLYELLNRDYDHKSTTAREGQIQVALRIHRRRERRMRNAKIVDHKRKNAGHLPCECCGFDFFQYFGEIGRGYAQVHHLNPLGDTTKTSETKLDDLVVLCANCHSMAHTGQQVRTVAQLRAAISVAESGRHL